MRSRDKAYLESSKNDTEDGEEETSISEAHLTQSGHGGTNDERQQREVGHGAVGAAVVDAVDENGEDRAQHAHGLVEGNGNHGQRQVGDGNVGGEKGTEGDQGEVLTATQSRQLEVAQLHHDIGTSAGERSVEEGQKPREVELQRGRMVSIVSNRVAYDGAGVIKLEVVDLPFPGPACCTESGEARRRSRCRAKQT